MNKQLYKAKYEALTDAVDNANAVDAVPVVRCKDCKHWKSCSGATEHVKCCEWAGYMVGENGYCVYGEKKEDISNERADQRQNAGGD